MTPADLSRTVLGAVCRAVEEGALHAPVPERIKVERPRPGGRGDYATNVALRLAGPTGRQARDVAEVLRARIADAPGIARVEITGPGFLNFTLDGDPAAVLLRVIGAHGLEYGHGDGLSGVRFGFAPARELRARVITDTVVRLLAAQGATAVVEPGGSERITALPVQDEAIFERAGRDAALWALLRPAAHDQPLAHGALLVQKESNALFRVRYAYSRSRALLRAADRLGVPVSYDGGISYDDDVSCVGDVSHGGDVSYDGDLPVARDGYEVPLPSGYVRGSADPFPPRPVRGTADLPPPRPVRGSAATSALLTALGDHPAVLESAARLRAPDRVARHLEATADALLGFQQTVLPLGDEKPSATHRSRLALAEAAGTVLAGGLALLGISAPEHL
ncbi:ArgS-related anticodon-binding protein NrtL [Streptomyces sp. WMMC940]|uniref:ArgS-related anticodon-binding protein NrtL n=1 Tax=Streptomyces sp. WMMC940 TaxID=3015153 RepID=UPI0022B69C2F|nr:DALR anticodon-binding domain-containing protein [Streptomyces sp. WMMC940]MCZ7457966.1 DALR anticodon-binding domain-containing protein [Streptomyces sp. WMMC940]